jgi:hypothetical protein
MRLPQFSPTMIPDSSVKGWVEPRIILRLAGLGELNKSSDTAD